MRCTTLSTTTACNVQYTTEAQCATCSTLGEIRRSLHLRARCTVVYLPDPQHSLIGWSIGTALSGTCQTAPHRQDSKYFQCTTLHTNSPPIWAPRAAGFAVSWLAQRQRRFVHGRAPPVGQRRAPQYHCDLCATAVFVPQRGTPAGLSQPDLLVRMSRAVLQRAASAHRIRSNSCVAAAANDAALQHQGRHAECHAMPNDMPQ